MVILGALAFPKKPGIIRAIYESRESSRCDKAMELHKNGQNNKKKHWGMCVGEAN